MYLFAKFHENPPINFRVILLTDRKADKRGWIHNPSQKRHS